MHEPDDQEAEWISRVAIHDDHRAFAELVRRHEAPVRGFLRRLCGDDWHRADDLTQETFWKAYRKIGSYRGTGRFLGWLFGIAWQLHAGQQRGGRGRMQIPLEETSVIADDALDVADLLGLEQLLRRLRVEEQAAMLLHYGHGLTHQEAAVALDLPLGTVKSLIGRACAKLRRMAEEDNAKKGEPHA